MKALCCAVVLAAACGGGSGPAADADPNAPDADPDAPDADPDRPDGGPGAPDAAPPATTVAACLIGCDSAADCTQAGELFGVDNYECDDGTCRWTGCNSTAECTATYMSPDYACDTLPGSTFASCYATCFGAADCAQGGELFGIDNYTCDGGLCRWTGCNSTAECTATYMSPDYACVALAGTGLDSCLPTCASAADCAVPGELFGADNYECDDGVCRWTGCNSTAECTATYMNADYICR